MADIGIDRRMVKIRLIGDSAVVEPIAEELVTFLEGKGLMVLEWTRPYPCRPPDENLVRIYVSARKDNFND